ncbi:hypothetical protein MMPV_004543 [Pyropia vietnamensis]
MRRATDAAPARRARQPGATAGANGGGGGCTRPPTGAPSSPPATGGTGGGSEPLPLPIRIFRAVAVASALAVGGSSVPLLAGAAIPSSLALGRSTHAGFRAAGAWRLGVIAWVGGARGRAAVANAGGVALLLQLGGEGESDGEVRSAAAKALGVVLGVNGVGGTGAEGGAGLLSPEEVAQLRRAAAAEAARGDRDDEGEVAALFRAVTAAGLGGKEVGARGGEGALGTPTT